jgi:hypothetical protein
MALDETRHAGDKQDTLKKRGYPVFPCNCPFFFLVSSSLIGYAIFEGWFWLEEREILFLKRGVPIGNVQGEMTKDG